ncbi:MAG: hypothetical protein LLG20_17070 [Acidobacteriales bacterium]|nr:hypothetical protein [Terriglobales bacterium]
MAQRHVKLSHVEAQKLYPFRTSVKSFLDAYPTVKSIQVEVRPVGEGFEPFRDMTEWVEVYNEKSIPAILDCRNSRCFGGGPDLAYLVRWSVIEPKRTEFETTMRCRGHLGSPRGRRNDGPCDTFFKVKVNVVYKDAAEVKE